MTLVELLANWANLSGPGLVDALEKAAADYPDIAPEIRDWVAALKQGLTPDNIISLSATILAEGKHVLQGRFYGTQKPQDLA